MSKVLIIASKHFGLSCSQSLLRNFSNSICAIATIDDSDDGRSKFESFLELRKFGVSLHVVENIQHIKDLLQAYNPDLVFVAGWYKIIPKEVLDLPPLGFIGFHFSLLPKYRGGAPVVWSIINGEREVGFSLFRFDSGMDTGPLYAQESVSVGPEDHIGPVLSRLEPLALEALERVFGGILSGELVPVPQQGTPSYGAQRRPEDGKIDWHWSQLKIYNFIRAQSSPYPGAYAVFNGTKYFIESAIALVDPYYGRPGQIVDRSQGLLTVICGDNMALRVSAIKDTVNN